MPFGDIACTRIGRYCGGEKPEITTAHPIIQFLVNPQYAPSPLQYSRHEKVYTARIPDDALALPPRITPTESNEIRILDVGCSSGTNLFLLRDLVQKAAHKPVLLRGYENNHERLKKARKGNAIYESLESLLHPVVQENVDTYFIETKRQINTTDPDSQGYLFSLREQARHELREMLLFGDALNLPEKTAVADVTICLYVLRYHTRENQLKIFRELLRVTKPGGYIFTEGYFFRRTQRGVTTMSPRSEPAVSFYDSRKALHYISEGVDKEVIWPVSDVDNLDQAIAECSNAR